MATSELTAAEQAAFAVSSRLISCLVTESLLHAVFIPSPPASTEPHGGVMLVIAPNSEDCDQYTTNDVFALVCLHHAPVLQRDLTHKRLRRVSLVDPLDMLPEMYSLDEEASDLAPLPKNSSRKDKLERVVSSYLAPPSAGRRRILNNLLHPRDLWNKYAIAAGLEKSLSNSIESELLSSLRWQTLIYESPPPCPSRGAPAIEWEQSMVSGHPTHPMHKARMTSFEIPLEYDWKKPQIRFVRLPRTSLNMVGPFESEMRSLAGTAAEKAGKTLVADIDSVIMPVHGMQLSTIIEKFDDVEPLEPKIAIHALAQSSTRTVVIGEMPGKALKLAVNVKISSALRTISHYTADFGPRFSELIVPKLSIDPQIFAVELEYASAVYAGAPPEVAKHLTALLRRQFTPAEGEAVIAVAVLLEYGHSNVPPGICALEHAFQLDTDEKRSAFVDRYIQLACEALIPPLVFNGVAFEAHAQNILARFDITSGELLGFVVRDLGGLRIHPETLRKSTGVEDFEFLPGHCVATETLEDTYPKFYHTLVHNHLQRLIRLMGLHYDGRGYAMLRRHLDRVIPRDHGLRKVWLHEDAEMVLGKCLMRMRLQGVYRDMVYSPFPNMIQYHPEPAHVEGKEEEERGSGKMKMRCVIF